MNPSRRPPLPLHDRPSPLQIPAIYCTYGLHPSKRTQHDLPLNESRVTVSPPSSVSNYPTSSHSAPLRSAPPPDQGLSSSSSPAPIPPPSDPRPSMQSSASPLPSSRPRPLYSSVSSSVYSPRAQARPLRLSSAPASSSPIHSSSSSAKSSTTPNNSNGLQSVVAGVIAGCVTRSCTSPLDVLKILIQVNGSVSRSAAAAMHHMRPVVSSSVFVTTTRELYSLEGLRGFWKGNAAGCCRLGPYAGAKFFLFDTLQAEFLDAEPSNLQRASCGAAAGLLATIGTYPMEVVRTRMITQTNLTPKHLRIKGVAHGLRVILRFEGLRGLYRGGWSGIIGAIPFEGVQFGCYEYLKHTSQAQHWPAFRWPEGKQELDGVDYFVCGSIAGAVAQTVAYPFDTVKKRLQTQAVVPIASAPQTAATRALAASTAVETVKYHGTMDCFRKVIRDEGLLALYRGTVPNLARIVPYAAVMFSTYELSKKTLRSLCEPEIE